MTSITGLYSTDDITINGLPTFDFPTFPIDASFNTLYATDISCNTLNANNMIVPRINASLVPLLGSIINLTTLAQNLNYNTTIRQFEVWDDQATGQIFSVDTSNNEINISTINMSITANVLGIDCPNTTIINSTVSFPNSLVSFDDNLPTTTITTGFANNNFITKGYGDSVYISSTGSTQLSQVANNIFLLVSNYAFDAPVRALNFGAVVPFPYTAITSWSLSNISGTTPTISTGRGFWDTLGPNCLVTEYPGYPTVTQALCVQQNAINTFRIQQSISADAGNYLVTFYIWGRFNGYSRTQTVSCTFGTFTSSSNTAVEQSWKKIQFATQVNTTGSTPIIFNFIQTTAITSGIVITNISIQKLGGIVSRNATTMETGSVLRPDLGLYCYGGIYNTGPLDNYGAVNIYGQLNPVVARVKNSMVIGNCKWGSSLGNTADSGQFCQLIGDGIAANISSGLSGNFTNIVAIGSAAMEQLNGTRTDMIAIGYRAARYASSQTSIAIGTGTMQNLGYSGASSSNIAIGHLSMGQMGSNNNNNNCCVGNSTLFINDFTNSRSFNSIFGNSSATNVSSNYHTIVGYGSFQNNISTGSLGNTVVGSLAGNTSASINTMKYNSLLGYGTDLNTNFNCENSTAIGAFAKILESDVIEMGGPNQTTGAYPKVTIPNKIQLQSNTVFGASASINLYFRIGENIILTSATTATINLPVPAANSIGCKFTIYRAYNVGVPTFITIQATAGINILGDGVTSANTYTWSGLQTVLTVVLIGTTGNAWIAGGKTLSDGSADQISTVQNSTNQTNYLTFGQQSANPNSYTTLYTDTNLTYNPGTDTMTVVNMNITRLSRLDQYLGETSPTIISATTTLASPFYKYYTFFNPAGATIQVTLPTITAANVGLSFTFNRLGGPYTAPNFTYLLQAGTATADAQPAFYSASPQGSINFTTLIGTAQSTSNVKSVVIQPAGAGQYSNTAGSTSLVINSVSSGFLNIGGRVVLDGATYRITAFGTGTGLTGSYTVTPAIPLAHTGASFTSNVSYGWVQTFVR